MQFALVVFRCVVPNSCPSTFFWSKARLAANSPVCCQARLRQGLLSPFSKTASSICGEFLPKTRWYALYPLSLFFDALAWFHSVAVLFKILPRRRFEAVLCHLVVIFLPIPCLHVLSCHFSTGPPSGVTSSLVPSLSTFLRKNP